MRINLSITKKDLKIIDDYCETLPGHPSRSAIMVSFTKMCIRGFKDVKPVKPDPLLGGIAEFYTCHSQGFMPVHPGGRIMDLESSHTGSTPVRAKKNES